MWSLQWQALYHSGIYEHPPIRLFVSWVGGCRVWSGLFTGGGSCWKSVIPKYNDMEAWNPNLRSKTAIRTSDNRYFVDPVSMLTNVRRMAF